MEYITMEQLHGNMVAMDYTTMDQLHVNMVTIVVQLPW